MKIKTKFEGMEIDTLAFSDLLEHFNRDQLRQLAGAHGVPRGRNKKEIIFNLRKLFLETNSEFKAIFTVICNGVKK